MRVLAQIMSVGIHPESTHRRRHRCGGGREGMMSIPLGKKQGIFKYIKLEISTGPPTTTG